MPEDDYSRGYYAGLNTGVEMGRSGKAPGSRAPFNADADATCNNSGSILGGPDCVDIGEALNRAFPETAPEESHVRRMGRELDGVCERLLALQNFMEHNIEFLKMSSFDQSLMAQQYAAMETYAGILRLRLRRAEK